MIVVMQIWDGDKDKSVHTARRLKELYPDVLLGVLANNCEHPKEIEEYADLVHTTTEDVFCSGTGGLAAHEILCLGLELPGQILVKIDPDTIIHEVADIHDNRFKYQGVFGKLQQTRNNITINLMSINGGAMGINRNAARLFVDEKILLDDCLITLNPNRISAFIRMKLESRLKGKMLSSHDWTIAWACEQLGVPMNNDELITSVFEHEERKKVVIAADSHTRALATKVSINSIAASQLRDEHLFAQRDKVKRVCSFLSSIWGNNGIVISKKDTETRHLIERHFDEIEEAIDYITFKDGQHMTIMARPASDLVQMIVIDLDSPYDCSVNVSTIKTSTNRYHVYMKMEPAISEVEAREIISRAVFADVLGSIEATLYYGCRVPFTPSYDKDCVPLHDGCIAVGKLRGEVELLKEVDKFYTKEEAIDVISQLSAVCKARPLETKEELVLL